MGLAEDMRIRAGLQSAPAAEDVPDEEAIVRGRLSFAPDIAPEQAARALKLKDETGLPTSIISTGTGIDDMERRKKALDMRRWQRDAPIMTRWLAEDPMHPAIAGDDLAELGPIEWMGTAAKRAYRSGEEMIEANKIGNKRRLGTETAEDLARLAEINAQPQHFGEETLAGQALVMSAQVLPTYLESIKGGIKRAGPVGGAAALVAYAATRSPALAAQMAKLGMGAGMAVGAFETSYELNAGEAMNRFAEIREESADPSKPGKLIDRDVAALAASIVGAAAAGLDTWSFGFALRKVPGAEHVFGKFQTAVTTETMALALKVPGVRSALARFIRSTGVTTIAESSTEALQELATSLGGEAAKAVAPGDFKSEAGEIPGRVTETFLQTLLTAPLFAVGPGMQFVHDAANAQSAHVDAVRAQTVIDHALESKTRKASPAKFAEAVERVAPNQTVAIPIDEFNTYFQSADEDPAVAAERIIGDRESYDQANAAGTDLVIPLSRYAAMAAEHHEGLKDDLRLQPGSMTVREAKEWEKDADRRMKEMQDALDESKPRPIYDKVKANLLAMGYEESAAERSALVTHAVYTTQAAREGLDPMQLFEERGGHHVELAMGPPAEGTTFAQDTPEFRAFMEGSKVVDITRAPRVVYHGTTHSFDEFATERSDVESDFGKGFYFTSAPEDVSTNYAGEGPDLTARIERLAEQIAGQMEDEEISAGVVENPSLSYMDIERRRMEMAREEARKRLSGGAPNVMPVYLALKNPVVIGDEVLNAPGEETFFTFVMEQDEEGEFTGEESGTLIDIIDAIRDTGEFADVDEDHIIVTIVTKANENDGISATDLTKILKEQAVNVTDDEGNSAGNEWVRTVFERAGYDGIIDRTVDKKFGSQLRQKIRGAKGMAGMNPDTVHYIAFRPEQIKSAIGNRGTYDPTNPNILFQTGETDEQGAGEAGAAARAVRDTGAVRGGERGLQAPGGEGVPTAAVEGLPSEVEVAGRGVVRFGTHAPANEAARAYVEGAGHPYIGIDKYQKVDKARAKRIADAFDAMEHAPNDPEVAAAYAAMIEETLAQWQAIKKTGLKVEFIREGMADPYAKSPRYAILDVIENNHLWVFPTDFGYGEGFTAEQEAQNPLLAFTDEEIGGKPARANDIFRIVHDYFGHIQHGFGFRADGEENAWRSHSIMYSPLARRAMTTETRGQNSWVNYGPHGDTNRTASSADTVYAPQKIGLLPLWVAQEGARPRMHPSELGTRVPSAKKGELENPLEQVLVTNLEAARGDARAFEKNVALVATYPVMGEIEEGATTEQLAEQFINAVAENLKWLHDQFPAAIRKRAKLWYDGANALARRWAFSYGVTESQAAGVLATLSPQKDWFQNVSLAERVLDIMSEQQGTKWDAAMTKIANSTTKEGKPFAPPQIVAEVKGKTLGELETPTQKAVWLRVYDETYNPQHFRVLSPEGVFGDYVRRKDGKRRKQAWGDYPTIAKAISVFEDGSLENVHERLGRQHKVRNFYNNILSPNSDAGHVTIDTHAVAAALLRPLSGASPEVLANFGGKGSAGSRKMGSDGTYSIYAEAYQRTAKELGLHARELQSIAWEAVRGLFEGTFKRGIIHDEAELAKAVSTSGVNVIQSAWADFRKGLLTSEEVRERILDAAGGIATPAWVRSHGGRNEAASDSSYKRELPADVGAERAPAGGAGATGEAGAGVRGELSTFFQSAQDERGPDKIKKGSEVWYLSSWDDKGTVTIEHFTVGSWGKQQGHLIRGNGTNRERRVYTDRLNAGPHSAYIFEDVPGFDPRAKALELAAAKIAARRAHYEKRIAEAGDPMFVRQMQKDLGELHEPRIRIVNADGSATEQGVDEFRQQSKGAITFAGGKFTIRLFEAHDLSTFLHESGHAYLEMLRDLARREGASEGLKKDFAAILKWLGVESLDNLTPEQLTAAHEKFAEGFEAYLMEGKAPSLELRSAFARFKAWLTSIYREAKRALLTGALDDEIRGVFDRLVASEEEIEAARGAQHLVPMWSTPEGAGMSPEQFAVYQAEVTDVRIAAEEKLTRELMEVELRERKEEWRTQRKAMRERVAAEVHKLPVYQALAYLQRGRQANGDELPEELTAQKIDRASLVEAYGADSPAMQALQKVRPYVYAAAGGMHQDLIAQLFGFANGDALVQAILAAPKMERAIEAETARRMREEHGDPLTDGTIAERAMLAVHNDKQAELLAAELRALRRLSRADAPIVRAAGAAKARMEAQARRANEGQLPRGREVNAIRDQAYIMVGAIPIARLRPHIYRQAEAKAARAAFEAAAKKDYQTAYAEKRKQLLNHELFRAAAAAVAEGEKIRTYLRKFAKTKVREKLGRAGHGLLEKIEQILSDLNLQQLSVTKIDQRRIRRELIDAIKDGQLVVTPDVVRYFESATPQNWRELTPEQLRGVRDVIKQLEATARGISEAIVNGEKVLIQQAADEVAASVRANGKPITITMGTRSEGDAAKKRAKQALFAWLRPAQIARELDGGADFGPTLRRIIEPIRRAYAEKLIPWQEQARKDVAALYRKHYTLGELGQFSKHQPVVGITMPLTRGDVIALALNWGNEGNRKALLDSTFNTVQLLTQDGIDAALATLTARDWAFVQDVWDYLDTYYPRIAEAEKRRRGIAPEKVEAAPFQIRTADGQSLQIKGGYYPLKYDADLSGDQRSNDLQGDFKKINQGGSVSASTKAGATIERVGSGKRPVRLNLDVIDQHLREVTRDLAIGDEARYVWTLLHNKSMQTAFAETGNNEALDTLRLWLQDAAVGEMPAREAVAKTAAWMRIGFTKAKLAWNTTVTLLQVTGLPQTMVVVGQKAFWNGASRFAADSLRGHHSAMHLSTFLRTRYQTNTWNKDVNDTRAYLHSHFGALPTRAAVVTDAISASFFWPIAKVQMVVDEITWHAGFWKGMEEKGLSQADAILYADSVVENAQTSGLFADRSGVERGTLDAIHHRQAMFVKLWTTMISYMLAKGNIAYGSGRRFMRNPTFGGAASFATDIVILFTVEAILGAAIHGRLPDDDDDDESWFAWGAKLTLESMGSGIPFIREVATAAFGSGNTPVGSITTDLFRMGVQLSQGEIDAPLVRSINNVGGTFFHYPSSQLNRAIDAYWRELEGEDVPMYQYVLAKPKEN